MAYDNPVNGAAPEKHPGGRPLKFKTVEDLDRAIAKYFKHCDPHWEYKTDWVQARDRKGLLKVDENGQYYYVKLKVRRLTEQQPYTMAGLAAALNVDRKTLLNYKKRTKYFPSIRAALTRCEAYAEGQLFGPFARGASFNLNNNYDDWSDRKELTGKNGEELGKGWGDLVAMALQVAGDDDGGTDTPAS